MTIAYRSALAALALTACAGAAQAQTEIGLFYGHGYYKGDIEVETKYAPLPIGTGKPAFGVYGRRFFSDHLAANAAATAMTIFGTDARRATSRSRNLSFTSRIYELSASAEYYPFTASRSIAPYLTGGVAYYHFNPTTEFNGRTVELQPLGTEGQGSPGYGPRYSLHRFAMPLGAGTRIAFGASWVLSLEARVRVTFFDHLDDVSGGYVNYYELVQTNGSLAAELANRTHEFAGGEPRDIPTGTPRGNPAAFDYYATAGVTVGYRIGSGAFGAGGGQRGASRYNRCYRF